MRLKVVSSHRLCLHGHCTHMDQANGYHVAITPEPLDQASTIGTHMGHVGDVATPIFSSIQPQAGMSIESSGTHCQQMPYATTQSEPVLSSDTPQVSSATSIILNRFNTETEAKEDSEEEWGCVLVTSFLLLICSPLWLPLYFCYLFYEIFTEDDKTTESELGTDTITLGHDQFTLGHARLRSVTHGPTVDMDRTASHTKSVLPNIRELGV